MEGADRERALSGARLLGARRIFLKFLGGGQ